MRVLASLILRLALGQIAALSLVLVACAREPTRAGETPKLPPEANSAGPEAAVPAASATAPATQAASVASDAAVARPVPVVRLASTNGMVLLPGGTLTLVHWAKTVHLAPFWIDVHEVTAADYTRCVAAGKCTDQGITCSDDAFHTFGRPDLKDHPINCVDYAQAEAYCAFAGKRLLTYAEWEWAARGADAASRYPWGDAPPANQLCWKRHDAATGKGGGTCQVGSSPKDRTPQGVMDMAGNVAEWAIPLKPTYLFTHGRDWMESDSDAVDVSNTEHVRATMHAASVGLRCGGDSGL